ncbi:hypothetical protein COCNU_06G016010 [Cocos nucifera]|uniref:Uncharacterized protein n=1 Tax=Cocos nucifera TaxID=13894 RepID=A0A8K0IDA4_COCNU|nr:hypothetical protein COCNU_06G016010 [Cocos nucifera]
MKNEIQLKLLDITDHLDSGRSSSSHAYTVAQTWQNWCTNQFFGSSAHLS